MMFTRRQSGFSLIEMLVAASIFMIIMVVVSGIYIRVLDIQRRSQGAARVQENILYVIETMAREIRVSQITSGDSPSCDADDISLSHPINQDVDYRILNGVIQRRQLNLAPGAWVDITSPEVNFTSFNLCVTGAGPDDRQARVTILLTAENITGQTRHRVPFTIQTTVASRDLFTDLTN